MRLVLPGLPEVMPGSVFITDPIHLALREPWFDKKKKNQRTVGEMRNGLKHQMFNFQIKHVLLQVFASGLCLA